ncbi:hypothetical protein RBY4I_1006 [Rhodobacterales bacterium Y4I]|nr:hypothetical protein RBY4I_1006 [Rhodobacterales bacterium Y4I]
MFLRAFGSKTPIEPGRRKTGRGVYSRCTACARMLPVRNTGLPPGRVPCS